MDWAAYVAIRSFCARVHTAQIMHSAEEGEGGEEHTSTGHLLDTGGLGHIGDTARLGGDYNSFGLGGSGHLFCFKRNRKNTNASRQSM